ncbi:MAG: hypothetical protein AABZ39_14010 [Spirochaetota bacterium]
MRTLTLLCLAFTAMIWHGCTSNPVSPVGENTVSAVSVGYTIVDTAVPASVSVRTAVWYPSVSAGSTHTYGTANGGNISGTVALNGKVRPGSWPIVVFSHGFSGGGVGQTAICEAIAREGYIVAAPDHSDAVLCVRIGGTATGSLNDALSYLETHPFNDGSTYSYRVREIRAVVDAMRGRTDLHVDPALLILSGHSMGAWTVMSAMTNGMIPSAMLLFSMGELNWLYAGQRYFNASVFTAMTFPTIYFYGSNELASAITAGRTNVYAAFCYYYSPSPSYGVEIAGGNHFVYNTVPVAGASGGTTGQFALINASATAFLTRHIRGSTVIVPAKVSK